MAVIALPSIAKFDDLELIPQFRNQVNRSAWTGSRKVMGLPGGECFRVSCAPRASYTHSADRLWRAFIMALRGTENRFNLPVCANQFSAASTNPSITGSPAAGATSANVSGGVAANLKAGMYATVTLTNGEVQLVVLTADVSAGVMSFQPALRRAASNAAVEVKNPYIQVAMVKDNTGWRLSDGKFYVAFDAEEAF
jgi:hypothetical protein